MSPNRNPHLSPASLASPAHSARTSRVGRHHCEAAAGVTPVLEGDLEGDLVPLSQKISL